MIEIDFDNPVFTGTKISGCGWACKLMFYDNSISTGTKIA